MKQRLSPAGRLSSSNRTKGEAIELGSEVGALIGLGIEGEEGIDAGAIAGAEGSSRSSR
jgi:hypothetical protein